MGCDIHTIVEIKIKDEWFGLIECPKEFKDRNYPLFAFLAKVRGNFNNKGFSPKGAPVDISEKAQKELIDKWESDLHSVSFLTLQELEESDKSDYTAVKCKVPKSFYSEFLRLGGILPAGMEAERTKPDSIITCIQEKIEPTMIVRWQPTKDETQKYPLFTGINELKEIAKKHNIKSSENIRIVFGFDN